MDAYEICALIWCRYTVGLTLPIGYLELYAYLV